MEKLQDCLNKVWSGIIEKHIIDLYNHFILFEIKVISKGTTTSHQLKFNNVRTIYYLNDQPPFEPEEDDYLELTSVTFEEEAKEIKINSTKNEYSYLKSSPNFLVEIWGRELLIDASSVEIDGDLFELGIKNRD
ncbi:YxiG family protein [Paenibacillus glufosinatiresistens]|uniref:YxiG family protein n=1 Tax=Paenibacillus glufosinatiresistens TaxID=3070657 RepID=UPI00286E17D6|nr:hypothetical protein [Paenibacillus sp. YX.27]